jgi:xanthine dehydrogenase YagS FAD-binding subunit
MTFRYSAATSFADAVARLAADGDAMPLGGGTDLIPQVREDIAHPQELVDLRRIPGSADITWGHDGAVEIGATARLVAIARDERLRRELPGLVAACDAVGSYPLRAQGTLGGNLCQRPRCWYLRHGFACHKNGGDSCPAFGGENQYHAIFGGGPCVAVHPSDPAVALVALDAVIVIAGPSGERSVPAAAFFVLPSDRLDRETVLAGEEVVRSVRIPAAAMGGVQLYDKATQRGAWDFALVSLAAHRRTNGDVRLVLGGVAGVPWRVTDSIEEDVASGGLTDDDLETLAQRALYDARPLSGNAYKVDLAAALLRRGMRQLL